MGEGAVEREYRKRRKLPGAYLALLGVVLLNALVQTTRVSGDTRPWWPSLVGGLIVVTLVRVVLEQFRAYTRVTAAGLTTQGPVRSRSWAWPEVYDIRVERAPRGSGRMAPRWLTYLYDFEGHRFQLPHLNDWQLDDPYAEVSDLCLAAAPYRSLAWERRPDVEERILRRAAQRRAWTSGAYGAIVVLLIMTGVDLWQVAVGRPTHPFLLFGCVPVASGVVLAAVLQWYWTARLPRSLAGQS
ncbi:PH domain-containing protein [Streptomyces sp. NPDC002088]|uniref:PH domain-containing protein n=1 Tax=Streptomyces sp. NPDC002088 TaxID=3154665 RepID=UPI00332F036B